MNPDISFIIPCYNDGLYIQECIDSILNYKGTLTLEIIIINDGSTDSKTVEELNKISKLSVVKIINTENRKMASARNTGIKASRADLFIPLDADDCINVDFIDSAYKAMMNNPLAGVIYGNNEYFGEKKGIIHRNYDPFRQLYMNNIVITSLVRKKVWESFGGFDEKMTDGYEDWDFWIQTAKHNWEFVKVDLIALYYRIKKQSTNTNAISKHNEIMKYIHQKHYDYFLDKYILLFQMNHEIKNNRRLLLKYLIRNLLGKSN